jgi:ABC-type multidrug transport system fused ATPase/permease subunit
MSEAGENDDADYRSLAAGYLSRAKVILRGLETRKRKLRFRASILSVLPPVVLKPIADALPNMDESQKVWLYVGSLIVGIAAGAFSIGSQLADSREKAEARKAVARQLIGDLESLPQAGELSAWHRQVVDEANATIRSLRDFMEQ